MVKKINCFIRKIDRVIEQITEHVSKWNDLAAEHGVPQSLRELIEDHGVEIRRFPDDVLKALWMGTQEAMQKLVAQDPMAAKVYASYSAFYKGVRNYHHISEQAYINMRDVVLEDEDY